MTRSAKLRRLHFLNALFAPLTGHDLYLAEQIDGAIAASLDPVRDDERAVSDPAFVRAAADLFARLCSTRSRHGFFHWDATADDTGGSPLFARAGLLEGLKQIAAYPESTVLVTNLRAALCPPTKRWTERRDRDYQDTLALLSDFTASRARRNANVNLLFL